MNTNSVTVPVHFTLPKSILYPFSLPRKHHKSIIPTVSIPRKHKKCIKTTVPLVGNPKIFIFCSSQQWEGYKYSFLPRPKSGTTTNIHFLPRPTLGTTIFIHFFSRPNSGNTKKIFFPHYIRAITRRTPILTVSPT
jgi:hypothetical protein